MEVDIRRNSAGELVLSHDRDESGAYRGRVTPTEAFDLVIRDGRTGIYLILTGVAAPSTFREAPEIAKNAGVWLNIEETVEDYYRSGAAVLEPYRGIIGPDKHHHEILKALPSPDFLLDPIIEDCFNLGVRAVNMPYAAPLLPLIPRFKARGIQVSLWTLNKRETLERAFGLGVLNITTRDTRLAVELRGHGKPGGSLTTPGV